MQVVIHSHSMNVSQRLEKYVKTKSERLERYLPGAEEMRVEFTRQSVKSGTPKVVELTVRRRKTVLRVEERDADAFKAFDNALDKMLHRVARFKGRRIDKKRSGAAITTDVGVADDGLDAAEALPVEAPAAAPAPKLVRIKTLQMSPMSVEEAIDQMELVSHDFYMFTHDEDGKNKVVYRRKEGGYGLLQPGK
jgi:putative sigma-54 modulation protein